MKTEDRIMRRLLELPPQRRNNLDILLVHVKDFDDLRYQSSGNFHNAADGKCYYFGDIVIDRYVNETHLSNILIDLAADGKRVLLVKPEIQPVPRLWNKL